MIYKDVIDVIVNALSRFKGVNFVKYTGDDLINAQNNNKTLQCWIDDISLHQFNLTTNIVKAEYQIYILGFPDKTPDSVLEIQDRCYNAAINIMAYIDTRDELKGLVSVYDYSILTLSHFTDDSSAGVKLSLVLNIPNGVDLCTLEDWFNDEPYTPEKDEPEIDLDTKDPGEITLKPVKLPKKRSC